MPDSLSNGSKPGQTSTPIRPLDYAPISFTDRLTRRLPNSDQIVSFFKMLLWVTPLTLLIWVYAEREQTVTVPGITIPIDVKTTDQNRMVTLRKPPDKMIIVELSGPRAKLDRVGDLLRPKPNGAVIDIFVDPQIGLGGQEMLTVAQINNNPIFKNNGISVKSAQPPYLFVDIDEYVEREAIVKAPREAESVLESRRFVPERIKVRAPSQLIKAAEQADPEHQLYVFADLSKREELKTKTGEVRLEGVPVYWQTPGNPYSPAMSVQANLVVKQPDAQLQLASVPIVKETPAGVDDNYRVVYAGAIQNVVLSGPAEQIEAIRKGGFKVKARLEITSLDPPGKTIERPLQFDLPPGVMLTRETADRTRWEFKLVDR